MKNTAWLTIWDKVKIPRCCHKLIHRERVTYELHDSYFCSTMIKHATPKRAEVAYSDGQLWEKIAWAWRRVDISAWEFDDIRPTNWTEDSEKFRCSRKLVMSLPRVRFLGHRLTYTEGSRPHRRTILIYLLIAPTSHKRPSRK